MQNYAVFSRFNLHWVVFVEAQLSDAFQELIAANLEMTTRCNLLEESFNTEKADKLVRILPKLLHV
jgi:hypothetical protein